MNLLVTDGITEVAVILFELSSTQVAMVPGCVHMFAFSMMTRRQDCYLQGGVDIHCKRTAKLLYEGNVNGAAALDITRALTAVEQAMEVVQAWACTPPNESSHAAL